MSWFGSNTVTIDVQVEKATDESIPFGETDLATSLEITDLIRSKQVLPKDAMRSLKKRLTSSKNPNTQLSTLHLIDTCVKNGGNHFIVEISTREFIDTIVALIHDDKTNENVRDLGLDLIQNWAIAFKDNFQFKYVVSTYEHLKSDGYTFPPIGSEISSKLFDSSAPPEWEDSDACMICSTLFSMLNRKHHCRNCGGVFCQAHSSKSFPLSHLGITEPVRVCDTCYDELSSKNKSHKSKKHRRSKHQKEVSRARAQYDSDDDEDLKKALELSLRESQGYTQVPIPVVPPPKNDPPKQAASTVDDEDDEDMKAAIAASLKDLEDKKKQTQQSQATPAQDNSPYANLLPQSSAPYQQQPQIQHQQAQPQQQQPPLNLISSQEESNIRQFSSKVDYYKANPAASTDLSELHESYRKAIPLTPKLSTDLNQSIDKYDRLVDLNSKVDTVMRLYNKMLDERIERESNYQRQQQQHQYQPQPNYAPPYQSYQQPSQPVQQHPQYAPPQQQQYQQQYNAPEPSSPQANYYRLQYNKQQIQSPYQQRESLASNSINSNVQSPVAAPAVASAPQPQYTGGYAPPPAHAQQQSSYIQEQEPPSYEAYPPTQQHQQPQQPEEEEEEEEFSAPPAQVPQQQIYEPTAQHVVQPEITGESEPSYAEPSQPEPQQNGSYFSPPQQTQYPQFGHQQQHLPNYPKVTDVTFPTVPMNKPPSQQLQEPVVPETQKNKPVVEEQLIEL